MTDIDRLLDELEQSAGSPELDAAMQAVLEPELAAQGVQPRACTTNLVEAIAMLKRVFPGWSWRVAECSVSDDAWLAPDFNCPKHGNRLREELCQDTDWTDLTDVDLRPPGRNSVALCMSMLLAKEAVADGRYKATATTD
jgi:hypothetical protein